MSIKDEVMERQLRLDDILRMPEEQQRVVVLGLSKRFSDQELAKIFNIPLQRVKALREKLGIKKGRRGKIISVNGRDPNEVATPPIDQLLDQPDNQPEETLHYDAKGSDRIENVLLKLGQLGNVLEALEVESVEYNIQIKV